MALPQLKRVVIAASDMTVMGQVLPLCGEIIIIAVICVPSVWAC